MPNEEAYFYGFVYCLGAYTLAVAGLLAAYWQLRKARTKAAMAFFFLGIVFDLLLYVQQTLPDVTMPRKDLQFRERAFNRSFPVTRLERPRFDDRFRYFAASLQGELTAFDGPTLDWIPFGIPVVTTAAELLEEINQGSYALSDEVRRYTVLEFISRGQDLYSGWSPLQKKAYLSFSEWALQDMLLQMQAYVATFVNIQPALIAAKKGINLGYVSLVENQGWGQKDETISTLVRLLKLDFALTPEAAAQLLGPEGIHRDSPIAQRLAAHEYLFRTASAYDYFINLWGRYQFKAVNTFVRLKDFDAVANIFERAQFDLRLNPAYKRIKEDAGITAPLVRFFPAAEYCTVQEYLNRLSEGRCNPRMLYLHTQSVVPAENAAGRNDASDAGFSYEVKAYQPNCLILRCTTAISGYLYFSDCNDRYWSAYLDGRKTTLVTANAAFKAIPLPAGSHEVRFSYNPLLFRISLWVYYLTVIASVAALLLPLPLLRKAF